MNPAWTEDADGLPNYEPKDAQERSLELADELCDEKNKFQFWTLPFHLARVIRMVNKDTPPTDYVAAAMRVCERSGYNKADFWDRFLVCWEKIRVDIGNDRMGWAAKMADTNPYPLEGYHPELDQTFLRLASIAYYLYEATKPLPCVLSQPTLAKVMGVSTSHVGRVIKRLEKAGLIECVDASFIPGKKARKYKFTGKEVN
jgi:hypothetical protein